MRNFVLQTAAISAALFLLSAAHAAILHVTIEEIKFNPEVLEVKKGDTVIWKNKDVVPHTVTAEMNAGKSAFDSGQIDPGSDFKLKIKAVGEISYKCLFHPTMKAKLKVQ